MAWDVANRTVLPVDVRRVLNVLGEVINEVGCVTITPTVRALLSSSEYTTPRSYLRCRPVMTFTGIPTSRGHKLVKNASTSGYVTSMLPMLAVTSDNSCVATLYWPI